MMAFTLLLAVFETPAQSGQNKSPQPDRWMFDDAAAEKINKNLTQGEVAVGLSRLEQQMLEKYGIGINQSFFTQVYGELWNVTRTSTGLRFERSVVPLATVNLHPLPMIQTLYRIGPAAFRGHDKKDGLSYLAWVFDKALQDKIQNRILSKGISGEIGLSHFQQKLLQRYGIQVGQSFRSSVVGRVITVKRVSLGLQIQTFDLKTTNSKL